MDYELGAIGDIIPAEWKTPFGVSVSYISFLFLFFILSRHFLLSCLLVGTGRVIVLQSNRCLPLSRSLPLLRGIVLQLPLYFLQPDCTFNVRR